MISLIKVGLVTPERFENAKVGQGIPRYVRELYQHLKNGEEAHGSGVDLEKIIYKNTKLGDAASFELATIFDPIRGYDAIHLPFSLIPHRLGKATRCIVTVNDTNPSQKSLKFWIWKRAFLDRGIDFARKRADKIIAISSQTKEELLDRGHDKEKITVINDGVDDKFLIGNPAKKDRRKTFTLGYLGSFAPNKNLDFAINAFQSLTNTEQNLTFKIYGNKTQMYKKLLAKVRDNRIKFMGFAPEERLVDVYDSFDAFTFPSLYEGFGLPILEAQARGIPVITYKKARIPKEVRRYCIEADDETHMAEIILDLKEKGYAEQLRKRAMNYARGFTWDRTARSTLRIYQEIME